MDSRVLIVDVDPDNYPIIHASDLCQINDNQRIILVTLSGVLFLLAVTGNVCSLYVNSRRKLRPFFRSCLISLACSDIIYCISFTTGNMGYFNAKYLEVWTLGSVMCNLVPFVNTATVLSSSLMLVAIAMDRYMAIRRAAVGIWNPGIIFCISCIGGIWLTCLCSAVPLFFIYKQYKVYVIEDDAILLTTMCMGQRTHIGIYNIICLILVFIPCIVAFVFLNVTIAHQLWQRRHQQQQQQEAMQQQQQDRKNELGFSHLLSKPETAYSMMTAFSVAATFDMSTVTALQPPSKLPQQLSPAAAARVARHRRMVRVVLLMMGVFICLRLPAWVFLLMRVYGNFSTSVAWLFFFSFGLFNLTSCAVNPLFYTFLTQTINVLSLVKRKLCCKWTSKQDSDVAMPKDECRRQRRCFWCGLHVTWRCVLKSGQAMSPVEIEPSVVASSLPALAEFKDDIFMIYTEHSAKSTASIESSYSSTSSSY